VVVFLAKVPVRVSFTESELVGLRLGILGHSLKASSGCCRWKFIVEVGLFVAKFVLVEAKLGSVKVRF